MHRRNLELFLQTEFISDSGLEKKMENVWRPEISSWHSRQVSRNPLCQQIFVLAIWNWHCGTDNTAVRWCIVDAFCCSVDFSKKPRTKEGTHVATRSFVQFGKRSVILCKKEEMLHREVFFRLALPTFQTCRPFCVWRSVIVVVAEAHVNLWWLKWVTKDVSSFEDKEWKKKNLRSYILMKVFKRFQSRCLICRWQDHKNYSMSCSPLLTVSNLLKAAHNQIFTLWPFCHQLKYLASAKCSFFLSIVLRHDKSAPKNEKCSAVISLV